MRSFIIILLFFLSCICNAQIITTIAGTDSAGYSGNGGFAINAQINNVTTLRFDKDGNLYLSDSYNNVIRKIDKAGRISNFAGNGHGAGSLTTGFYSGDGGPTTSAELTWPTDIAFDVSGNAYIVDGGNNVIRKVNNSGIITTIAGNGIAEHTGDGDSATKAGLNGPYGIAIDVKGNIYISEVNSRTIRRIDSKGIITTIAGGGSSLANNIPATTASFVYPGFIALNNNGDLFIPDWTHYRVCKVDASGTLTIVAGNGIAGNNGDGGLAINAELTAPTSVSFDDTGNMYISDNFAYVIRKVNKSGIISTIAGNGLQGFSGDGGPALLASFNDPNGPIIGPDGNLYISDIDNHRIRKVTYTTSVFDVVNNLVFSITPDPSKDQVAIQTDQQITNIEINNSIGQTLYNHAFNNTKSIQLSINDWPAGVYFVRINNTYVQKLIKE